MVFLTWSWNARTIILFHADFADIADQINCQSGFMDENDLSFIVRGSIFEVYNHFGPGLFENVYKQALQYDLIKKGLRVLPEVGVSAIYKGEDLGLGYRMDLLINEKLIVEVKSIDELADVHHKQLLTYLKLANLKLGILVNFNTKDLKNSIKRVANGV